MTLNELIESCGITKVHLAKRIGMNEATFKNKLSENHSAKFSPSEELQILQVLEQIGKDIKDFISNV